jgi:hypothetical protein
VTPSDPFIRDVLDRQVPVRLERRPDWADVLARSANDRDRRHRRTLAVIAIAAALAIAASALAAAGHDPFGTLSAWLNGSPGTPASKVEQAGFTARNGASYAAFPAGTKLRRLDQATVAGKSFVLLGFKSGESLCLQLEQAGQPSGRAIDQCVTLRELDSSAAPALVAAETFLEVGKGTTLDANIVGFADDTVKEVQFRSGHGPWQTAPVKNNVFLGLVHRKAVAPHALLSPPISSIDQVRALTKSGSTIAVPFVSGYISYPTGLPSVPSYVRTGQPKPAQLPGPAKTTALFPGGAISWLVHHQPRGTPWRPPPSRFLGTNAVVYSRAVQPDPANPLRVGLFLRTATGMFNRRQAKTGGLVLCKTDLYPLTPGDGWNCFPPTRSGLLFPPDHPFELGGLRGGQQVTELTGVAADAVASLKLYLGSGRVIPVALSDNAFSVGAPETQFPAKLVAFNARGRVLGLEVIAGPAHPVPCPLLQRWPASKLPATRPYQRIDLGALTIDGQHILGMTPAQVTAALGKPTRAAGFKHLGFGQPAYFYGGTLPSGTLLRVQFRRKKNGVKAVALEYQGRGLTDAKLGHLLNVSPQALERSLTTTYGYRITSAYGSAPAALGNPFGGGCSSIVTNTKRHSQIEFGLNPTEGARPFLNINSR